MTRASTNKEGATIITSRRYIGSAIVEVKKLSELDKVELELLDVVLELIVV